MTNVNVQKLLSDISQIATNYAGVLAGDTSKLSDLSVSLLDQHVHLAECYVDVIKDLKELVASHQGSGTGNSVEHVAVD